MAVFGPIFIEVYELSDFADVGSVDDDVSSVMPFTLLGIHVLLPKPMVPDDELVFVQFVIEILEGVYGIQFKSELVRKVPVIGWHV